MQRLLVACTTLVAVAMPLYAQTGMAEYTADVLPDAATPAFAVTGDEDASIEVSDGVLTLTTPQQGSGGIMVAIGKNTPDQWVTATSWGEVGAWDAARPTTVEFRMRVTQTLLPAARLPATCRSPMASRTTICTWGRPESTTAPACSELLPDRDKEKQMLQGLLMKAPTVAAAAEKQLTLEGWRE